MEKKRVCELRDYACLPVDGCWDDFGVRGGELGVCVCVCICYVYCGVLAAS